MTGGRPRAFIETEPLFEDRWTGIPNVIAAIVEGALGDPSIDWGFTFKTMLLPRDLVERMVAARSGAGGIETVTALAWEGCTIPPDIARSALGLYTNIKPMRRFFAKEAMIAYDLSPLLTPAYHNAENISHFADRIREDIATSEHVFCISQTVMSDVATYFGKPRAEMSLIEMGVAVDLADVAAANLGLRGLRPEPYVVIIGTLEPRKNGRLVLDYLRAHPDFAGRYRILFIGRDGWLDTRQALMEEVARAGVGPDRVVFTGYLTDAEKTALLMNAAFCVYPSLFEGYGLPVLEAAAFGQLTVCSDSSSMPEVAPDSCIFFDPTDVVDLARAMREAELRSAHLRARTLSVADIAARAAPLAWSRCYPGVARWVHEAA